MDQLQRRINDDWPASADGTDDGLFFVAIELPPGHREVFLEQACGTDEARRRELLSLIEAHESAGTFLQTPALAQPITSLHDDAKDEMVGSTIGSYRILERVGAGGMGAVYRAERADRAFERQVAIKIIKRGMDTDEILQRFRRERELLASLDHPNIARLIDGGATPDGRPYLVMEHVAGTRIDVYCRERRLSFAEVLRLFRQTCDAVQHAHQRLIVHRDLKPSNIFVTDDGRVKLLDFGIARVLAGPESDATATGARFLTPRYGSPEQLRGEPVSTSADVYSLGVILYELLTGRHPYSRGMAPGTPGMDRGCSEHPPAPHPQRFRLRQRRGELGGDLGTVVLKAIHRDPLRRYQSALEFSEDIRRHLAGLPVAARPDRWAYRTAKFIRRNVLGVSVTAVVAILLVSAAVVSSMLWIQTARHRDMLVIAEQSAQRSLAQARRQGLIAQEVLAFLNDDLLALANPAHQPSRAMTVEQALDAASLRLERMSDGDAPGSPAPDRLRGRGGRGRFADEPLVEAAIRKTIAGAYAGLGSYERSLHHATKRLERLEHAHGLQSVDFEQVLEARSMVAAIACALGRCAWSVEELREVLAAQIDLLGEDDPETRHTMLRLARVKITLGMYAPAESMYERIVAGSDEPWGAIPGDMTVLEAMGELADIRRVQGRLDEAEAFLSATVDGWASLGGMEHPKTLEAMQRMGQLLHWGRRFDEAEHILKDVLETRRRVLGEDHPQTAFAMTALGMAYMGASKDEEAESLLIEALQVHRRSVGEEHPQAIIALHNLGMFYQKVGRLDEATTAYAETARIAQRLYPEGHRDIGVHLYSLGRSLLDAGRLEEAAPVFERVHEIFADHFGPSHPMTLRAAESIQRTRGTPE